MRHLVNRSAMPFDTVRYGPHPDNIGDLRGEGRDLVVLAHGGLWKQEFARDGTESLAIDLARRGYRTWNLEYRRLGGGGGWPGSGHDVLTALRQADRDGILPVRVPGLGFAIIVCAITLLGAASPLFLGNPLIAWARGMLEKVPLVKLIYTAVKDLMAAFVGEKQRFKEPVLVTMNKDSAIKKLGFITQHDLSQWGLKDQVAVYLPHSYNFSGNLFIVPREAVMPLNVSGPDAMKFIVSGGVTDI